MPWSAEPKKGRRVNHQRNIASQWTARLSLKHGLLRFSEIQLPQVSNKATIQADDQDQEAIVCPILYAHILEITG